MYGAVPRLLDDDRTVSVTTLPDGSVDMFYRAVGPGGPIATREEFARRVADGTKELDLEPHRCEPGGQAVNMALQAHALADDVRLFGHLAEFPFPFEAVSMGEPARVTVLEFDDEDLMLAERSADRRQWSLAELRAAGGPDALQTEAVCCGNWAALPGLTDVLRAAAAEAGGDVFVFDTGGLAGVGSARLRGLRGVLANLADAYDVIVSANRWEVEHAAARLGVARPDGNDAGSLQGLREATGVAGVVCHEATRAVAATPEGVTIVPNLETRGTATTVGGGDRFDAGLAHALAVGWDWKPALALANACASFHVERGTAGTHEELAAYVREREPQ